MSHTSLYFRDASALPKLVGRLAPPRRSQVPLFHADLDHLFINNVPSREYRPGPPRRRASAAPALREILYVEKFSERSLHSNRRLLEALRRIPKLGILLNARVVFAIARRSRWWPGPSA